VVALDQQVLEAHGISGILSKSNAQREMSRQLIFSPCAIWHTGCAFSSAL